MRVTRERATPLNADMPEGPKVRSQSSAAPAFSLGVPAPHDPLQDLAQSLSHFNSGLSKYLVADKREKDEAAYMAGMRARTMQAEKDPVAMTPEQNPYWQKGYMTQHGKMSGLEAATEFQKEYEKQKDNPDFNFESFAADFRNTQLQGFADKDALEGMLPMLTRTEGSLREHHVASQLDKVRKNQLEYLSRGAEALVTREFAGRSPDVRAELFQRFVDEQVRTNNRTKAEARAAVFTHMASQADKLMPEDLEWMSKKDADGVSFENTTDAHGNPYADNIARLRHVAAENQKKLIKGALEEHNKGVALEVEEILAKDPMSIKDVDGFVMKHGGPNGLWNTASEVGAAKKRILKAQEDWLDDHAIEADIARFGPQFASMIAGDAKYKKYMEKVSRKNWEGVDLTDPAQVSGAIQKSLNIFENLHYLDPKLESLMKETPAIVEGLDANGKPNGSFSPAFRVGLEIYRSVGRSRNPRLNEKFSEDTLKALEIVDRQLKLGASESQALGTMKRAMDPEVVARRKAMFPSAEHRSAQLKDLSSDFTSWASLLSGRPMFGDVVNANSIAARTLALSEDIYASGGYTPEEAVSVAKQRMQARTAFDGYRGLVEVPPGVDRDTFQKGVQLYVGKVAANYKETSGEDLRGYVINVVPNGQNSTVEILNGMTWDRIGTPKSITELNQAVLKDKGVTFEQSAYASRTRNRDIVTNIMDRTDTEGIYVPGKEEAVREVLDPNRPNPQTWVGKIHDVTKTGSGEEFNVRAPKVNPDAPNKSTTDYARDALSQNNPAFALTAYAEGMRTKAFSDPAGYKVIGVGYSLDPRHRSEEQIAKDFKAAGIVGDRVARVIDGKEEITPEEAQRLFEVTRKEYEGPAKRFFGESIYNAFPDNVKAVMRDMAWVGGTHNFKRIVEFASKGDWEGAAAQLTLFHKDKGTGAMVANKRRVNLWQSMLSGIGAFKGILGGM